MITDADFQYVASGDLVVVKELSHKLNEYRDIDVLIKAQKKHSLPISVTSDHGNVSTMLSGTEFRAIVVSEIERISRELCRLNVDPREKKN